MGTSCVRPAAAAGLGRVMMLAVVLCFGVVGGPGRASALTPHTALVQLDGEIAVDTEASADRLISALQGLRGSACRGGGHADQFERRSPCKRGIVNDESGGSRPCMANAFMSSWKRCAPPVLLHRGVCRQKIYADKASVVGSIGEC